MDRNTWGFLYVVNRKYKGRKIPEVPETAKYTAMDKRHPTAVELTQAILYYVEAVSALLPLPFFISFTLISDTTTSSNAA